MSGSRIVKRPGYGRLQLHMASAAIATRLHWELQVLPSKVSLMFYAFDFASISSPRRNLQRPLPVTFILLHCWTKPKMLKTIVPRAGRSILTSKAPHVGPSNLRVQPTYQIVSQTRQQRRGYASEAPDYDVVFIGGGVAGYVGAIKAGQEGLKV